MASTPDIKTPKLPAAKPEREVDIQPEDIKLGTETNKDASLGKSQLKRPRSAAGTGITV